MKLAIAVVLFFSSVSFSALAQTPPKLNITPEDIKGKTPEEVGQIVMDRLGIPKLSEDEEWACTCVLCVLNPNGAKAVKECVPPIERLEKHLKKNPFPKCPGVDAELVYDPYDPCPSGYTELGLGQHVYVNGQTRAGRIWTSIIDSETVGSYHSEEKICVRGQTGTGGGSSDGAPAYGTYESILLLPKKPGAFNIRFTFENGYTASGSF
jgi:hypothetical protein